jgi:hypothetical protein
MSVAVTCQTQQKGHMKLNASEQLGHDFARGATIFISKMAVFISLVLLAGQLIRLLFGLGMDDSDKSRWNRSGLSVRTDAKTGIEYLVTEKGGITPRK